ncbi:hypothetical protein GX50_03852 [[Emmonsia] crescens]|uniref:Uncharacterized protein n=1 Tax=[Emmonsia] crescens TaxID=73230 RepID=A0A2B7ZJD3_9EURO|nr:hypothetical protein GX50_03852 [Emmonsia crescens]
MPHLSVVKKVERSMARAVAALEAIMERDTPVLMLTPTPAPSQTDVEVPMNSLHSSSSEEGQAADPEEDVEVGKKGKRFYHGLEPGSCIRCLKEGHYWTSQLFLATGVHFSCLNPKR